MNLIEKLSAIQRELHVEKKRYNKFGKYYYRSAEDILEALKPYSAKYKVTFRTCEILLQDMVIQTTSFIHDQESDDVMQAAAIVGVEKAGGMALPQAFGAASSYGKKYAYGNLLMIDDTQDADASNKQETKKTLVSEPVSSKRPVIDKKNIDKAKKFISNGGLLKTLQDNYEISAEALIELGG